MIRPLGTVVQTAQGLAILRVSEPPELGTAVVNADLDGIGTVVDVFGPTEEPYIAVSPTEAQPLPALLGERVYVDQRFE